MKQRIYLDNAATTAIDAVVLESMMPYLTEVYGNPNSTHLYGRESRLAIENARKSVAKNLGAKPSEIYFTSCGTESNNTAIRAAVRDLGCRHIISSRIEHHAVLNTVLELERNLEASLSFLQLLPNGHIDLESLEAILASSSVRSLVTLMHGNNEIGTISAIEKIAALCEKYDAVFHSDCVQTVGHYPFNLRDLPIHFISASAHKFHGPKGSGLLYIKEGIKIRPFITGGGQERGIRSGTENVAGIVGFAKALELATISHAKESRAIQQLKIRMISGVQQFFPAAIINGDTSENSLYTVLSVSFPKNVKTEMLLMNLDVNGISVSGGSACSGGHASHVMEALGIQDRVNVRISFSKYNTAEDVDLLVEKMVELVSG